MTVTEVTDETTTDEKETVEARVPYCPECLDETDVKCGVCLAPWHACCCDAKWENYLEPMVCSCQKAFLFEWNKNVAKDHMYLKAGDEVISYFEIEEDLDDLLDGYAGIESDSPAPKWWKKDKEIGTSLVKPSVTPYSSYQKCRHYGVGLEVGNGVTIYVSSQDSARIHSEAPDFGLYAASSWQPYWRNEHIGWPDMGIPKDDEMAVEMICEAFERAMGGQHVELGCIGGHGRTGTMLACMYLLGSEGQITAEEACWKVWNEYCTEAIETPTQAWWVGEFAHMLYGHDSYEKPKPPPPKVYSSYSGTAGWNGDCAITTHYALMSLGWTECPRSSCTWFVKDLVTYKTPGPTETQKATMVKTIAEKKLLNPEATKAKEEEDEKTSSKSVETDSSFPRSVVLAVSEAAAAKTKFLVNSYGTECLLTDISGGDDVWLPEEFNQDTEDEVYLELEWPGQHGPDWYRLSDFQSVETKKKEDLSVTASK